MNKALLLLSASIMALFSCESKNGNTEASASSNVKTVSVINLSPSEFQEKSSNGIIVDVRTPKEIADGKIADALGMDYYAPDFISRVNELPKEKEIFIYCAVGARSREAAEMLTQKGYTKVYHLSGGIQAWARSGLPIVQE